MYGRNFARRLNEGFPLTKENMGQQVEALVQELNHVIGNVYPILRESQRDRMQPRNRIEDERRRLRAHLQVGDQVLRISPLRRNKIADRYDGPFTIHARNPNDTYLLTDGVGNHVGTSNLSSLVPLTYTHSMSPYVDKIINSRGSAQNREFLCDYPRHPEFVGMDPVWIPASEVDNRLIRQFWDRHQAAIDRGEVSIEQNEDGDYPNDPLGPRVVPGQPQRRGRGRPRNNLPSTRALVSTYTPHVPFKAFVVEVASLVTEAAVTNHSAQSGLIYNLIVTPTPLLRIHQL